jgi:two-component system NtrC family sensor kinase
MKSTTERLDTEELFKILGEEASVGMCIMQDSKICYANSIFPIAIGYTRDELVGRDSLELVVPEDRETVREGTIKMLKGELRSPYQFRVTCKEGSVVWVMGTVKSIQYQGRPAVLGSYMETTERKRMEEAAKESEERYKELANSITEVFFAMDEHLRYTYWNKASELLTGVRAEDALGKSLLEVFPDSLGLRRALKVYRAVLKTQKARTFVNDFSIDGRHYVFEIGAYPSRGGISVFVRDITGRRQVEEALRQSEEKYRTILEEMEDAYFEVDLGGHLTFVNNSVCRDLGYSREELMGMSYKGFTAEADIKSVSRVFNEVYRTGTPNKGFPFKTIRKDGVPGFAETSISLLRNDKGEIIGFRGVGRDVTERKQAEEKLCQSKENYRALFDSSVIGAVVVDAEAMKITMANQAALRMFGFGSPEAGVSPLDFSPPEDRRRNLELIVKEVFEKDSRKSIDLPAMTRDGRKIWVSVTGARITYKGKLAGLFSFADITERKEAEEKLRQSEENYRALFDSSVIGTIVLDAATAKAVMANEAAARTFGFGSPQEGIGQNPLDFVPPEDREMVSEAIKRDLFEQDTRRTSQFRALTKSGREIWLSVTAARITHQGKLAGLISFADITEQKLQNERLVMADRLASIGELAAGTAHELNNPLASIIGLSELLMEKDTPNYIRKDLAMIRDQARRAANTTSNLLTFARKHTPVKQLTQINPIIEDVLELRAYAHKSDCIEIERHLASDLPEIQIDPFQMQQVFLNVVINAEYFMIQAHKKGRLAVTTKRKNGSVRISFADDGPGIPPEDLGRIFDPFFTTKEAGRGTGLGLSICHGTVAAHGGQIYARSQLGKGATIIVELPINGSNNVGATS